ncbi:ATP-binding protein [Parapedobacter sp. 2B3]|uniref:ATP-binding protein n=1 Tax=Parapedobacter sp. 2B3 TaxID=3342381 RepID=UPI0035B6217A
MNLRLLVNQSESRRLELKQQLPKPMELAKTIVAFANDAGGELIIGVQDSSRKPIGVPENIKVAIFDDMMEITSPGKLLPSIDLDELKVHQSDIRNKVIAPIFERVGLMDQWGNGLFPIYLKV